MDRELLEHYLRDRTRRQGALSAGSTGTSGSTECGDVVQISLVTSGGRITRASFEAGGCGATVAAAAAAAEAAEGTTVVDAARISTEVIAGRLGGLSPSKLHAAELAADATHRAISALAAGDQPLSDIVGSQDRVLVAMSGGVDSAVAALLEQRAGREVVGVTLKLWQDQLNDGGRSCCSPEAVFAARSLAHRLGIPHLTLDLQAGFAAQVVEHFVDGYASGLTPNPCVRCNGGLRIDAMLELADRLGAATLATGHYARLRDDGEGPLLATAADAAKDQTYMLAAVSPASLARLRFPLGELEKPAVRALARDASLSVADKAESQDLCFLAGEGKQRFLERHGGLGEQPGRLVDERGVEVGRHRGHHRFTVGQRRGIGVAGPEPLFVLAKDARANTVTVGPRDRLAARSVTVGAAKLYRTGGRVDGVRLRSHAPIVPCRLESAGTGESEQLTIWLERPVHGVAPGQTACLMASDLVAGAGTILAAG